MGRILSIGLRKICQSIPGTKRESKVKMAGLPVDYYAALGIPSSASQQQIRDAYKRAAAVIPAPIAYIKVVAGNRLGAVRDAKGKSVYAVFQELPQDAKGKLLSQLAAKVFSHAVGI